MDFIPSIVHFINHIFTPPGFWKHSFQVLSYMKYGNTKTHVCHTVNTLKAAKKKECWQRKKREKSRDMKYQIITIIILNLKSSLSNQTSQSTSAKFCCCKCVHWVLLFLFYLPCSIIVSFDLPLKNTANITGIKKETRRWILNMQKSI